MNRQSSGALKEELNREINQHLRKKKSIRGEDRVKEVQAVSLGHSSEDDGQ